MQTEASTHQHRDCAAAYCPLALLLQLAHKGIQVWVHLEAVQVQQLRLAADCSARDILVTIATLFSIDRSIKTATR